MSTSQPVLLAPNKRLNAFSAHLHFLVLHTFPAENSCHTSMSHFLEIFLEQSSTCGVLLIFITKSFLGIVISSLNNF